MVDVAYVGASPSRFTPLALHFMVSLRQTAWRMTDPDFSSMAQCCLLRKLLSYWWLNFIRDWQSLSLLLEDSLRRTFVIVCRQFLFFALSFMQLLYLIEVFNFDPLEVINLVLVLHHEHLKLVIDLDSLESVAFCLFKTVRWLPRCLSWVIARLYLDLVGFDWECCSIVEPSTLIGVRLITLWRSYRASPSINCLGFDNLHRIYMTVGRVCSSRESLAVADSLRYVWQIGRIVNRLHSWRVIISRCGQRWLVCAVMLLPPRGEVRRLLFWNVLKGDITLHGPRVFMFVVNTRSLCVAASCIPHSRFLS